MKKSLKRLNLNVETLRHLNDEALRNAAGLLSQTGCGTVKPPCEQSFVNSCLC